MDAKEACDVELHEAMPVALHRGHWSSLFPLCHLVHQVSGSGSILSSNCATAYGGLFLRSRPTSTGCGRVNGQSGHFRPGAMIVVRSRMAANEWPKNIPAAVHLTPKAVLRAPGPGSHEQSLQGQLTKSSQILTRNCEGRPRGHR